MCSHDDILLRGIIVLSRILIARPCDVTGNLSFIKTRIFTCSQGDLELYELSRLKRPLAWLNCKFVTTGEALLAGIDVRLRWEVVGEGVIPRHVVQYDQTILCLSSSHLLEIYLFYREKDLRADLAYGCPLPWNWL